jgi:hypothetical protein
VGRPALAATKHRMQAVRPRHIGVVAVVTVQGACKDATPEHEPCLLAAEGKIDFFSPVKMNV